MKILFLNKFFLIIIYPVISKNCLASQQYSELCEEGQQKTSSLDEKILGQTPPMTEQDIPPSKRKKYRNIFFLINQKRKNCLKEK